MMEQPNDILKPHPSKQEISMACKRHNLVVKVFGQLIDKIEEKNLGDKRWFIFSEKIGKKYLSQAYTLQQIFANDIYIIKGQTQQRFIDFSSIFSLLRVQLETYAVFFHLFADECRMEEKIIRFRLWELDGLRARQQYTKPDYTVIADILKKETKDIDNCLEIINQFSYFKNLDKSIQDYLLFKYATWRFNDNSLKNPDKNKRRLSINQMIVNTGLKASHFDNWYSYTSTHAHTTYWSVIQNDSLTDEEKITGEYIAIMQSTFITSFFIKDFYKIYEVGKTFFNSLPTNEQEIINSFDIRGRNH